MTPFERKVLTIVSRIPVGRVTTYGDIARLAGRPGAARAVGNIMQQANRRGLRRIFEPVAEALAARRRGSVGDAAPCRGFRKNSLARLLSQRPRRRGLAETAGNSAPRTRKGR